MYRRVLLAYDGSREGRVALREGALLARACGAKIYLLAAITPPASVAVAEAAHPGPVVVHLKTSRAILDEGVVRLRGLGCSAVARLAQGDPVKEISAFAHEIRADLVVIGHRRQSLAQRWWSGPTGAYLTDNLRCSVLVARSQPDDA